MESDFLKNVDYPIDSNPLWKLLERNYDNYFLNYKGDKTPVIPKKIHQIWLGSPLPIKYFRLIKTWIDKHPDWEYKLWTDRDVEPFGMVNKKLFDAIDNHGVRTDIFRYEIMYREGGLYLDTDFKCIKPFDDLLHLDFFCGSGFTNHPCAFNSMFAIKPQHPLMLRIINELTPKINTIPTSYSDIMEIIGSTFFSGIILDYIKDTTDKAIIFPKNFFFPFSPELRNDINIQKNKDLSNIYFYIKERTYCVHLWFTSWQWESQIQETPPTPPVLPKKKIPSNIGTDKILTSFLKKVGDR